MIIIWCLAFWVFAAAVTAWLVSRTPEYRELASEVDDPSGLLEIANFIVALLFWPATLWDMLWEACFTQKRSPHGPQDDS